MPKSLEELRDIAWEIVRTLRTYKNTDTAHNIAQSFKWIKTQITGNSDGQGYTVHRSEKQISLLYNQIIRMIQNQLTKDINNNNDSDTDHIEAYRDWLILKIRPIFLASLGDESIKVKSKSSSACQLFPYLLRLLELNKIASPDDQVQQIKEFSSTSKITIESEKLSIDSTPFKKGGMSKIYKATLSYGNIDTELAGKYNTEYKMTDHEANLMIQLNHPNIVFYQGTYPFDKYHIILMNRYQYNLLVHYRKQKNNFTQRLRLARDVVKGIEYLHSKRIIHCDLAPVNIFIDETNIPKIGDFGLSLQLNSNQLFSYAAPCGQAAYNARETLRSAMLSINAAYQYSTDIYSLGLMLFEIYQHDTIYYGKTCMNNQRAIIRYRLYTKHTPDLPLDIDRKFESILDNCWNEEEDLRPTATQLAKQLDLILRSPTSSSNSYKNPSSSSASTASTIDDLTF